MKKLKNSIILDISLSTVFLGLIIYSAYSLWYMFAGAESGFDVHFCNVLTGFGLGWFLIMLLKTAFKSFNWIWGIISLTVGNGLFQGLLWGINAAINTSEGYFNEEVVVYTYTVVFTLSAIILSAAFIIRAKSKRAILNIVLAIIYSVISCGGVYVLNIENIKALSYKNNIKFDTITAEEASLTKYDTALCTNWFKDNFIKDGAEYPFTFKIDGEEFDPAEWDTETSEITESSNKNTNGNTESIVLINKDKKLKLTVEATVFTNNATCQWIVYIENTGKGNSGVISDFYALYTAFDTGKGDIYYSMGSNTAASDFSLIKKSLGIIKQKFSGVDGKPTEAFLPYFNIRGENYGMVVGIGWTGQWAATFSEKGGNTNVTAKQESFNAYLLPGEKVRSPLVSVSFYQNDNPLKGFNLFRNWVTDCVYPENVTKNYYTVMEVAGPTSTRTADEIINILDNEIDKSVYGNIDAFWMDAGWYSYTEGWHDGVGNWTADTSRYDNGISELSEYAENKGLGHTLWYEPERVNPGTHFHKIGSENSQWLIEADGEDNIMWNLANEDAFAYYCDYLLNSMKENGVTIYRQDFNFAPLKYWEKADREFYDGRTGICENRYITNLYAFLDYLTENIDGLIIDNCASGGKRLDLEMTYRSIAFWRSDYNCAYHPDLFNATQSHTYGASFWLPITGSALWMESEYSSRSAIMPLMLMDFYSHKHADFSYHNEQRALMGGNYYPLDFGSFDNDKMLAMEFLTEDSLSGTALIYKREKVTDTEYTVKLNGLVSSKTYKIYDIDKPDTIHTLTGEELMTKGLTLPLPEGAKAIILMFNAE